MISEFYNRFIYWFHISCYFFCDVCIFSNIQCRNNVITIGIKQFRKFPIIINIICFERAILLPHTQPFSVNNGFTTFL